MTTATTDPFATTTTQLATQLSRPQLSRRGERSTCSSACLRTSKHHEPRLRCGRSLVHASYPASTPQGHAGMIARWTRQRSSSLGAVDPAPLAWGRIRARGTAGSSARTRRIGTRRGEGNPRRPGRARTRRGTTSSARCARRRLPAPARASSWSSSSGEWSTRRVRPFRGTPTMSLRLFAGAPRRLRPRRGRSSWHSQTGLWTRRGRGAAR